VGPGERVLVVGDASLQPLAVSLENTGAEVVVHGDRLEAAVAARRAARSPGSDVPSLSAQPAEGRASFDHLLAVIADGMSPGEVVAPVVGLLRVDGYAGIGVTATPHPLLGHVPTVRRLGRELAGYGLAVERVLAVRQSLADVRHLVPLSGQPLRWFLRDVLLPWSPRGAIAARLGAAVAPSRLLHRAFPALFVVARRVADA
jgi:hypothetical protein